MSGRKQDVDGAGFVETQTAILPGPASKPPGGTMTLLVLFVG
jgi:hypothetical protein